MTDDLLDRYRDSLAAIHMDTPAGDILARGDRLRSRRRLRRWATAGVGCAVAVAITLTLLMTGGAASPTGTELAAFTVTSAPAGASTLTLHKDASTRLDPDALREALAERGITAKVTVGSWCDTATEPSGLHDAVTLGHDSSGAPNLTIHPDAIPAGAELSIGYFPTRSVLALIRTNAPLSCATDPKQAVPAASRASSSHVAMVLTNA